MIKILVITDNRYLFSGFREIVEDAPEYKVFRFDYACTDPKLSAENKLLTKINVKKEYAEKIAGVYDIVLSMHCKQLFPAGLVTAVRCINIHPGLNPYNRGWFPQVFSIINKLPVGATIHEIDEEIDHGAIIIQQEVPVAAHETSADVYQKVLDTELILLRENLYNILTGNHTRRSIPEEGNLNLRKDFDELCQLDLNRTLTMGQAIDLLRALTHDPYNNAYFIDADSGKKIYVGISLNPEN